MATFVPGSASEPTSDVELTLSCRNLSDCDVFSKSDPMCVTYYKSYNMPDWQEIHRTECIHNTLNPNFASKVHLTYRFEEQQMLKFAVYDVDASDPNLYNHDFLGHCETTLGKIVASAVQTLRLIGGPHNRGEVIVSVEEMSQCRDEVCLQFCGRNLDRKDFFGSSDPFLELYKVGEDGQYRLVHRTEVIKWNLNPKWKPFTLPVRSLCGSDLDRSIKIVCYDWNRSGNHSLIGELFVTLRQLGEGPGPHNVFYCIHVQKQKKKKEYKNSGEIRLVAYDYRKIYSFLDYIRGGTQLHCTIAIDFTASNGDPQSHDSLHFFGSPTPNQYEQALTSVGEIIEDYDADKQFPVLGFGARLPPDGRVSHEFFVNMRQDNPYCAGISGAVEAYKNCIKQIQLYGPTNFSPVINHVAKFAQAYRDGSHYFILLIITDGVITDMVQTRKAIIYASSLPMSIIIVGVGNADFSAMTELDGDTVPLMHEGRYAERDIVQFVPFRNFQRLHSVSTAKAYLAKEVLAEVPDQVVGYMKSKNLLPKTVPMPANAPPVSFSG